MRCHTLTAGLTMIVALTFLSVTTLSEAETASTPLPRLRSADRLIALALTKGEAGGVILSELRSRHAMVATD